MKKSYLIWFELLASFNCLHWKGSDKTTASIKCLNRPVALVGHNGHITSTRFRDVGTEHVTICI